MIVTRCGSSGSGSGSSSGSGSGSGSGISGSGSGGVGGGDQLVFGLRSAAFKAKERPLLWEQ